MSNSKCEDELMFKFEKKWSFKIWYCLTIRLRRIQWINITRTWNNSRNFTLLIMIKIMTQMISKVLPNRKVFYLRSTSYWTFSVRLLNLEQKLKLVYTERSVLVYKHKQTLKLVHKFWLWFYINSLYNALTETNVFVETDLKIWDSIKIIISRSIIKEEN